MQQTGTGTGHWINMLVPKNSIKSCQKYMKVVEYWHGKIKNYRYDGDISDDKTDMSEDYEKFDEIAPFTVNIDPSIQLNDEDFPWLCRKGTHAKKKFHTQRSGM